MIYCDYCNQKTKLIERKKVHTYSVINIEKKTIVKKINLTRKRYSCNVCETKKTIYKQKEYCGEIIIK